MIRNNHSQLFHFIVCLALGPMLTFIAVFLYLNPQVPAATRFHDVHLQTPLRIYDNQNVLIAEYGNRRRIPTQLADIPEIYIKATLSIEDKRFFQHPGVDLISLANALARLLQSGIAQGGASTITMQLARNLSLGREQTFIRKFKEILLALKLEQELSKSDILEVYLNLIPFGKRAYGAQAAAHVYYGKPLSELNLAQIAMLAGIPQAPTAGNPINSPTRALKRRNLVLQRMLEQGQITSLEYSRAISEPITASLHQSTSKSANAYFVERVRRQMVEKFNGNAYKDGYQVRTTLDSAMQRQAELAVRRGIMAYDARHGYRGREDALVVPATLQGQKERLIPNEWQSVLKKKHITAELVPAIVASVQAQSFDAFLSDGQIVTVGRKGFKWARRYIDHNTKGRVPPNASFVVRPGYVVRLKKQAGSWVLSQLPKAQAALTALSAKDGAIQALTGGFDFEEYQFDHALQAKRQPGSSFKPFIYSAALNQGVTLASIFNDAPLVYDDPLLEGKYRPKNYGGKFLGPIRIREAFYRSINLVSIRVLRHVTTKESLIYLDRFGFDTADFPNNLQLALGGGTIGVTPLEMARAYAVFANGGHLITPYMVTAIESSSLNFLEQHRPPTVCNNCLPEGYASLTTEDLNPIAPRVLDERVAFQMKSLMKDVIRKGTGRRARALKRSDLAGKTGTTDAADTWFNGFSENKVVSVWFGLSDNSPVGKRETGASAALPIWIDFMGNALPKESLLPEVPPAGLVQVLIDLSTGKVTAPGSSNSDFEWFRTENAPSGKQNLAPDRAGIARDQDVLDPASIF